MMDMAWYFRLFHVPILAFIISLQFASLYDYKSKENGISRRLQALDDRQYDKPYCISRIAMVCPP